jgi:hypothetical protein
MFLSGFSENLLKFEDLADKILEPKKLTNDGKYHCYQKPGTPIYRADAQPGVA